MLAVVTWEKKFGNLRKSDLSLVPHDAIEQGLGICLYLEAFILSVVLKRDEEVVGIFLNICF